MGMYGVYYRLPLEQFRQMEDDIEMVEAFFGMDIAEEDEQAYDTHFDALEASGRYLNIDKAWHGLHFLLTGDPSLGENNDSPPLANVVQGGTFTDWEPDFDAYRFLMPEEVREVCDALRHIRHEDLRHRFDPAAFNAARIYPLGEEWTQEQVEWFIKAFDEVAAFFDAAAQEGEVILMAVE